MMAILAPEKLSQNINPWTWWLNLKDNTNSFINVNYKSNHSETEEKIISEVAGYGMQLDVIEHTIQLMIDFIPKDKLSEKQKQKITEFHDMMLKIQKTKEGMKLKRLSSEGISELINDIEFIKKNYPEKFSAIKSQITNVLNEK